MGQAAPARNGAKPQALQRFVMPSASEQTTEPTPITT
jgi:hypothetical protein